MSIILSSCHSDKEAHQKPLEKILANNRNKLAPVINNLSKYRVQILYTQIDRDAKNRPSFTTHSYRLNDREYFYPASSIKLPVALLALEKINKLNKQGVNKFTTMLTDSAHAGQTPVKYDSSAKDNRPDIAHYIKKIFLVSDNDAYNRLYEFCGQQFINESLRNKGYKNTRIITRLAIALPFEQNRYTNPVRFVNANKTIYEQKQQYSPVDYSYPQPVELGKGAIINDSLVREPKDFSVKNRTSLTDLQNILKATMFPQHVNKAQKFNLTSGDYQLLYKYMSGYSREIEHPAYDPEKYHDSYVKFLMFGAQKDTIPNHIRIFNKVGNAYGFLVDNAYIVDFKNKVEFFITAVVYVNENEIFNDGHYKYDEIGYPFLANLGQAIYEYELNRPRAHLPDLSKFKMNYE